MHIRTQFQASPQGFRDRSQAGKRLGARLIKYAGRPNVLVLGLPRGGIPEVFSAVGQWYMDLRQVTDEEVKKLLARGAKAEPHPS